MPVMPLLPLLSRDTLTSRLDIPVPNSDFSVGWVGTIY